MSEADELREQLYGGCRTCTHEQCTGDCPDGHDEWGLAVAALHRPVLDTEPAKTEADEVYANIWAMAKRNFNNPTP